MTHDPNDATLEPSSPKPQDALLHQLQALVPEAFSESRLDVAALKRALGEESVIEGGERYALTWAGKANAYKVLQTPSAATLRPQRELSVNFDAAQHVFIEGENLEVLKVLQKAYFGKVKLIYIDPPYNTGSDSFIYPDRFQENKEDYLRRINDLADDGTLMREGFFRKNGKENGHYHSNWLSMMLPRLYIARNLLRDDGLIFVSCDDNEVHNLRLLMNEVFGEENFRGEIARGTGTPTGQGTGSLVNEKDYLLVYAKTEFAEFSGLAFDEQDQKKYDLTDDRGRYLIRPLRKTGGEDRREDRPTMYFSVTAPDGSKLFPVGPGGYESRWRCGPTTYKSLCADGLIEWRKGAPGDSPLWKVYQKFYLEGRTKQASNLWTDIEGNKKASRDLSALLGGKYFDHPKPIELMKTICLLSAKEGIVVDFFAGSGTTGQAVLELNYSDGGKRQAILVQLPEPCAEGTEAEKTGFETIAQIGRARLSTTISNLIKTDGAAGLSSVGLGFKSYLLTPSNFKQWRGDEIDTPEQLAEQIQLFARSEKDGAQIEHLLCELLLKFGQELTTTIEVLDVAGGPVFAIADRSMLFVLETMTDAMIDPLVALKPREIITIDGVFHDSDTLKTNFELQCRDAGIKFTCL